MGRGYGNVRRGLRGRQGRHTCSVDVIQQVWQRALTPDVTLSRPDAVMMALAAVMAMILGWVPVRNLVTVFHEAGHAIAAVLAGRRVTGITVHPDASGLTLSRGRPYGLGMAFTLFAGYLTPSLVGLGLAWLAHSGHSALALWLIVVAMAVMLLSMRNFYGALIVAVIGIGIAAGSWFLPLAVGSRLAYGLAWLMLLTSPVVVFGLFRGSSPSSDPAKLAAITHVPGALWVTVWLVLGLAALWWGGTWLLNIGT